MDIRRALPADLPAVAAIYAREALEGHATFDLEPRPMELWEARLRDDGEHFLVSVDGGTVTGYATSSPFRPKPAYAHTRETTVYVAAGQQGRGTGRALYDALLALLADDGVHLVVAAVALPNPGSLAPAGSMRSGSCARWAASTDAGSTSPGCRKCWAEAARARHNSSHSP